MGWHDPCAGGDERCLNSRQSHGGDLAFNFAALMHIHLMHLPGLCCSFKLKQCCKVDRSFLLPCSQGARLTGLPPSWDSGVKGSSAGPTPPAPPGPVPRESPDLVWHNLHPCPGSQNQSTHRQHIWAIWESSEQPPACT